MTRFGTLLATAAVVALSTITAPAQAAGAQRAFQAEDYDAVEHFDAGGDTCVSWAGSFHEVRHGGYAIVAPPGGQVDGETHVNGAVDGYVELVPDDPANPTYTGTYREKIDAVFLGTDANGDDVLRVGGFWLNGTLQGSDGSSLRLRGSGKVTMNANGRVVVSRGSFGCS